MSKIKKQYAEDLAREYELGTTAEDFFCYIVESLISGNRIQVREMFNKMTPGSKTDFLINFLDPSEGYDKSVLNICIIELIN